MLVVVRPGRRDLVLSPGPGTWRILDDGRPVNVRHGTGDYLAHRCPLHRFTVGIRLDSPPGGDPPR